MLVILFFLAFYVVFLIACVYVWNKKEYDMTSGNPLAGLSVVVCARNEEEHIGKLLEGIVSQTYQAQEIIVVDDGSTDSTSDIVRSFPNIKLLITNGVGKKAALKQGIEAATYEIIVCTDADCKLKRNWLQSIAVCFEKYQPSLLIMPVKMEAGTSFWQHLQALEFMSLAAVTAGSAVASRPVMCNGANLAFRRDVWLGSFEDIRMDEPSGDDMFFLISCKKKHQSILYLKTQEAMVSIEPPANLRVFCQQRRRWVSKSKSYTDIEIVLLAAGISIVAILPLLLVVLLQWKVALLVWGIKTVVDAWFLSRFSTFFQVKNSIWLVTALSLVYPFYIGYIGITGMLCKVEWK